MTEISLKWSHYGSILQRIRIYNIPKVLGILFKVKHTGLSTLQYQTPGWFQSPKKKSQNKKPQQPLKKNNRKTPTELHNPHLK